MKPKPEVRPRRLETLWPGWAYHAFSLLPPSPGVACLPGWPTANGAAQLVLQGTIRVPAEERHTATHAAAGRMEQRGGRKGIPYR
jgi:hypothetical protein